MIELPLCASNHPDRGTQAEVAIEAAFDHLAVEAERIGWTRDKTAHALLNLAVARVLTVEANMDTDEAIARAVKSVQGGIRLS